MVIRFISEAKRTEVFEGLYELENVFVASSADKYSVNISSVD